MLIKAIIIFLLFLIISSLFSALYAMIKDRGQSHRTVKMLPIRIGLSFKLGWISPHPI